MPITKLFSEYRNLLAKAEAIKVSGCNRTIVKGWIDASTFCSNFFTESRWGVPIGKPSVHFFPLPSLEGWPGLSTPLSRSRSPCVAHFTICSGFPAIRDLAVCCMETVAKSRHRQRARRGSPRLFKEGEEYFFLLLNDYIYVCLYFFEIQNSNGFMES